MARPAEMGHHEHVVFGAHVILYSNDADADRVFLAEVHPAETCGAELYLMTDDLSAEMSSLGDRGVVCSEVEEARWGSVTKVPLPGGGIIGLYQPRHPLAIEKRR